MAKGDDLEERLVNFAAQIVGICGELPKSRANTHIIGQLLRSGTAPAANYAEARVAQSPRDFVHKLRLALKEMNESRIWLKILVRTSEVAILHLVLEECDQLCRILNASVQTAERREAR